jgi:hypothetical protein
VIDASVQLLLAVLTGWIDRQERDVLRYLAEERLKACESTGSTSTRAGG